MLRERVLEADVLTMPDMLIDPDWRDKPMRPWEDVYDELCQDLGHHYGLNDIRDAQ